MLLSAHLLRIFIPNEHRTSDGRSKRSRYPRRCDRHGDSDSGYRAVWVQDRVDVARFRITGADGDSCDRVLPAAQADDEIPAAAKVTSSRLLCFEVTRAFVRQTSAIECRTRVFRGQQYYRIRSGTWV